MLVRLEDSLIQQITQLQEAVGLLKEMSTEHKAYEQILTDPDVLADYTCEFFGENGPYPVEDDAPAYPQAPTFAGQQLPNPAAAQGQAQETSSSKTSNACSSTATSSYKFTRFLEGFRWSSR